MEISQALALVEGSTDPLAVLSATESVIAWAHAQQVQAMYALAQEQPPVMDPVGNPCDPAPAEVAAALMWSTGMATARLDLAHELVDALPSVLTALSVGLIDLPKASEIVQGTCELSPDDRIRLAKDATIYAATHTRGQLRAWLARHLAVIDEQAAARRRRKATRRRRVWVQPDSDGMATLGAYLTAEEAQACWNALVTVARTIEGGVDGARADTLVALMTGLQIGQPVPVQVIQLANGAELAAHGPIDRDHAADLCQGAERIGIPRPGITIGYRPGVGLARYVRATDRHCRFPGCRRPAVQCDLDHVVPYPAGLTGPQNLACLCRYHHRVKTHGGWRVEVHPGRVLRWTSPRGKRYRTSTTDP